jgi:preprotein translocase subunit SecE
MATDVTKSEDKKDEVKDVKVRTSPLEFYRQVLAEASKVTWPTRKETTITATAVFAMVFVSMLFFLLVDFILRTGVSWLLGI